MRWLTESVISDISGKKEIACKYVQVIFRENYRVLFLEMLFLWSSRQMFICVNLSSCITWCVFISFPLLLRGEIKFKLNWILDRKAEETALMKIPFVRTKITILIIREIIKHCGKDVFVPSIQRVRVIDRSTSIQSIEDWERVWMIAS